MKLYWSIGNAVPLTFTTYTKSPQTQVRYNGFYASKFMGKDMNVTIVMN